MNDFTMPLKIDIFYDYVEKSTKFSTLESVEVEYLGTTFDIPRGFVSDGCSIPRGLWNYVEPFDGRYLKIFTAHDWFYSTGQLSRLDADKFMYEGLRQQGMSWTKANSIYYAVRMFGKNHYDDKTMGEVLL